MGQLIGDDIPKNCHWMDDITVSFQSNVLTVGDKIELRSTSYIKAPCASVATSCAPTGAFVESFAIIQTAVNPISPDIVISLPKYAGPSSPLTIDLTSSSGQGGRDWSSLIFDVFSTYEYGTEIPYDTVHIQSFLDHNYTSTYPPIPIPSSLLQSGASYTFSVTLCNFLSICSRQEAYTTIVSEVVPDLTILGGKSRNVYRTNPLTINSQASTSSGANLDYYWNVQKSNSTNQNILSASKDPTKFILPANTLDGNSYTS